MKPTKSDKLFTAILAKNQLAKFIASLPVIQHETLLECLKDIEAVIGTANQPNVEDTYNEAYNNNN